MTLPTDNACWLSDKVTHDNHRSDKPPSDEEIAEFAQILESGQLEKWVQNHRGRRVYPLISAVLDRWFPEDDDLEIPNKLPSEEPRCTAIVRSRRREKWRKKYLRQRFNLFLRAVYNSARQKEELRDRRLEEITDLLRRLQAPQSESPT